MSKMKHESIGNIQRSHRCGKEGYESYCREFVTHADAKHTSVNIYELPPKNSYCPYHFHHKSEETFYIISGEGLLRTPDGERKVCAGDLLFFPSGAEGAHKLTNSSDTENLVYIDFDVVHDLDVAEYPDSNKIAIWGEGLNKLYRQTDNVGYFDGE